MPPEERIDSSWLCVIDADTDAGAIDRLRAAGVHFVFRRGRDGLLDRELLRKFYLSEGYADFRIVSAVAELLPDRSGFFITFTISEGERYKFGKIDVTSRFEGLDVATLKSYLTMSEGDWYDADQVEKTVTAMADAVGTLGYAFVDVRPNIRRNKDDLTVDVTFDVQEGPRVYVERINHAVELYRSGAVKYIIMTGGKGLGERVTEADAGRDQAIAAGVRMQHGPVAVQVCGADEALVDQPEPPLSGR